MDSKILTMTEVKLIGLCISQGISSRENCANGHVTHYLLLLVGNEVRPCYYVASVLRK